MPRSARIVAPGLPHHVTQRGNRGIAVFTDDSDRLVYLSLLRNYSARRCLAVWAYCLMPNHIHLIAVPEKHESLALALHDTHTAYAVWANRKQGASGHLWQGRFYSCVMDETHLTAAARYVERNPVRAGMVPRAEEYAWSSAAAHCGTRSDNLITPDCPLTGMIPDWSRWLADEDIQAVQEIRQRTRTGKPCVNPEFVALLESMTGRSLRPAKRGRKPLIRGQTPN